MLELLLVIHETAKTSVAAIAVSGVTVGLPLGFADCVVRMDVAGQFFLKIGIGYMQAALEAAGISVKRHRLRSDDRHRQTNECQAKRPQGHESVPQHVRELVLSVFAAT